MVLLYIVNKISKIEKTENKSSNDAELEIYILEEEVSIIKLDSEKRIKYILKILQKMTLIY